MGSTGWVVYFRAVHLPSNITTSGVECGFQVVLPELVYHFSEGLVLGAYNVEITNFVLCIQLPLWFKLTKQMPFILGLNEPLDQGLDSESVQTNFRFFFRLTVRKNK